MWQNGHLSLAFSLKNKVGKGRATLCGKASFLIIQGWYWFQELFAADSTWVWPFDQHECGRFKKS